MCLGKFTFHAVNYEHKDDTKSKVYSNLHCYLDEGTQLSQTSI